MIFIGLFLFIAVIIVALNMLNSSNLESIKEYIVSKNCENIIYSKGSYKALCKDNILEVSNSFTVDLEKNSSTIDYKDIKNIEVQDYKLVINDNMKIKFATEDEAIIFYNSLREKIK